MTTTEIGAAPPDPAPQIAPAHHVPIRLVLGAVAATLLFASLGQTIVSTALPVMVAELGGMNHITWVMTAYLMASTIGAPVAGKLGDLFGRKTVLQWGIGVFILGAVLCGVAQNMGMVIAGRLIQGAGGGALIVTSMAVVGDLLPARERAKAQAILGSAFGISTVIGPLLGGFLVENLSWHWIFFVNFPVGIAAFVVLGFALPNRNDTSHKTVDYAGGALLATLLAALVLISNTASAAGWASTQTLALAAIALAALVLFIRVERRANEPILPMSLFTNNTFLVVNAVGILVGMAMFGTITFLPFFLQVVKGVSPTTSGLFLVPMMGGLLTGSMLSGRFMARTGRYKLLPVFSTALLSLSLLSLTTLSDQSDLWLIAASMVGVGLGLGPVFAIGVAAIQNSIPVSMLGVGTASANMFRLIGGSVGTAAFGALFSAGLARSLEGKLPAATAEGGMRAIGAEMVQAMPAETRSLVLDGISTALHPVFWIAAGAALLACLISTMLHEEPLAG